MRGLDHLPLRFGKAPAQDQNSETSKAKVIAIAVAFAVEWALAFAFAKHFANAVAEANAELANAEMEYGHMHYIYGPEHQLEGLVTGRGHPAPEYGPPWTSVPDWSREVPTTNE